jgi:hypothetical protein
LLQQIISVPLNLLFDLLAHQEAILTRVILFIGYLIIVAIDRLIGTALGALPVYQYKDKDTERVQA